MIKVNGYESYNGGKGGNGTYQTLINLIPPHKNFYSLFLGNCGVTRYIKPAAFGWLNDIDPDVQAIWQKAQLPGNYSVDCCNAVPFLNRLQRDVLLTEKDFIFLDPPYLKSTRKSQQDLYRFEMNEQDHAELLSQITAMVNPNIMICSYPNEMYDTALAGWVQHDFYSKTRNGLALERVYMNYAKPEELHDYSFLGEDFREREANNRIRRNMVKKINNLPFALREAVLQDLSLLIKK